MASLVQKELQEQCQPSPKLAFLQLTEPLYGESGTLAFQDLLRRYQKHWKELPEAAKNGSSSDWVVTVDHVQQRIKSVMPHMTEFISCESRQPALLEPRSGRVISHTEVREFIENFDLMLPDSICGKPRVAVVLPNGPLLALALLAVANRYTVVPMATTAAPEELMTDLDAVGADAVLMLESDTKRLHKKTELLVFTVQPEDDLTFSVTCTNCSIESCRAQHAPNGPDELAIILATSGSSGNKKLVPITMFNLLASATFVMDSLELTPGSRCLNMMPLHHVGGMMRNLWAPLVAGGMTICCSQFDPNLFWDMVEEHRPTWYYAAPTMHEMIVAEAAQRVESIRKSTIATICNGAAALPPNLAQQLGDIFQCSLSLSYGMTECVPITAPPKAGRFSRPGSTGLAAGPELAIFHTQHTQQHAPTGSVGRICVRGLPVFPGYLIKNGLDRSSFTSAGWFDTGDLGYVDENGWLYITGRTKEVINRGGETISPVEVEDAMVSASRDPSSNIFGRIREALAFPTPHDALQEVVGVAIVTPAGRMRPDLRQIHKALRERLHQPKWPVLLVYMDGLPKSRNKLRRIGLSQRLGLETLTDQVPTAERHYEALCPPVDTPVSVSITRKRCEVNFRLVEGYIAQVSGLSEVFLQVHADGYPRAIIFRDGTGDVSPEEILASLPELMHGYLIPSRLDVLDGPMPRNTHGLIDEAAVQAKLTALHPTATSSTQQQVSNLFATALRAAPEDMTPATDFFESGGDSMSAGQLISKIRQEFRVPVAGDVLFQHSTVGAITAIIEAAIADSETRKVESHELPGCRETYSSTHPWVLFLNFVPSVILYPMLQALRWSFLVYLLSEISTRFPLRPNLFGRLLGLILIQLTVQLLMAIISPLIGIALKWLLVGRYRAGMYPMWGPYHMRWWLAQKALQVCGKGVFDRYGRSRIWYYRALGARIGRNVFIDEFTALGEYDLLHIGDGVVLENCICRPFASERNTSMLLQPITIGANSYVGLRSTVVPGTTLPPSTCVGANSSTWEVDDADESNRDQYFARDMQPHWIWHILVVGWLQLLVHFVSELPRIAGLLPIVSRYPAVADDRLRHTVSWLTSRTRIGYFLLMRLYSAVAGPFAWFLAVLVIKRGLDAVCGRPSRGPMNRLRSAQKVRHAALYAILPQGDISRLAQLVGPHYELVSVAVRLLGGSVGKRVYWPRTELKLIPDFDLVDIGHDVVFGSRSCLVTIDGLGRDPIVIKNGAMLGDRCVVLPGVTIGTRTMVGSGALLRRNGSYPDDSVWTGSKHGDAVRFPQLRGKGDGTKYTEDGEHNTTRPFGRALYLGKANYHVLGQGPIVGYSSFMVAFTAVYSMASPLAALLVLSRLLPRELTAFEMRWWRPFAVYGVLSAVMAAVALVQGIVSLAIVIASKWMLLGRRQEGSYPYDRSSYCQRWQIQRTIDMLIEHSFGGTGIRSLLSGTAYLSWFYRAMGATIGADCALSANGEPHIFLTEPDLVTLGDRVTVDDASLVCHLNTRGDFELHPLRVSDRSVMRTGSRLLSGASMGKDACLLEHTLVLSGDHVEDGTTLQGWPAEEFRGDRLRP
ncbi:acetyl-CoA synthetase-like protein [Aspergillus costaricaensis CBS 115574]|uniref:Acetyl-CoA synthetase-like protein n=1 Tax=Aspergillus costaricaensis CBS 115574 TaxID=1448317 RepID=A0ACD1ITB7_9EURO|nr:acetyl-CoA synthetase-like protein [Aspergillus costaricaensis CBS 115574]RAK93782.1 acetyl-CoA synthetase-like protein [Aspergillus costaricaensis CBS 115574]